MNKENNQNSANAYQIKLRSRKNSVDAPIVSAVKEKSSTKKASIKKATNEKPRDAANEKVPISKNTKECSVGLIDLKVEFSSIRDHLKCTENGMNDIVNRINGCQEQSNVGLQQIHTMLTAINVFNERMVSNERAMNGIFLSMKQIESDNQRAMAEVFLSTQRLEANIDKKLLGMVNRINGCQNKFDTLNKHMAVVFNNASLRSEIIEQATLSAFEHLRQLDQKIDHLNNFGGSVVVRKIAAKVEQNDQNLAKMLNEKFSEWHAKLEFLCMVSADIYDEHVVKGITNKLSASSKHWFGEISSRIDILSKLVESVKDKVQFDWGTVQNIEELRMDLNKMMKMVVSSLSFCIQKK